VPYKLLETLWRDPVFNPQAGIDMAQHVRAEGGRPEIGLGFGELPNVFLIIDSVGEVVSSMEVGKYNLDNIYTRGGAMDIPKRATYVSAAPCVKPVYHLNVNYDGRGMLCCHTRTDYKGHQDSVITDLSKRGGGHVHILSQACGCSARVAWTGQEMRLMHHLR
jgi:hypothetical protein